NRYPVATNAKMAAMIHVIGFAHSAELNTSVAALATYMAPLMPRRAVFIMDTPYPTVSPTAASPAKTATTLAMVDASSGFSEFHFDTFAAVSAIHSDASRTAGVRASP